MSTASGDGGEKTHEPSQKKLDDARKRGDVARSDEVTAAAVYLGLLVAAGAGGAAALVNSGQQLSGIFAHADTLTGTVLGPGGRTTLGYILTDSLGGLAPLFTLPALFALAALVAQRGIAVSGEKITPKLSRLSPLAALKNKFGPTGLMDFAKRFIKLLVVSSVAFTIIWSERDVLVGSARATPGAATAYMLDLVQQLLISVTMIAVAIAGIDLAWVQFDHRRKLKMSLQELRDESKEAEGDPALKAKRRRRATDIATNRMLVDVPTADVVIVNPTHVAVALAWDRTPGSAPRCVAKGADALAATIRDLAAQAGVPVQQDAPTARALFATVDVGAEVPPDHYSAVAVAIRFAEDMRSRMRAREGPE